MNARSPLGQRGRAITARRNRMIRNLKVLLGAAMALAAFGALSASAAHAAGEKFHCSVEPCTVTLSTDGTGTTAHHVFIVENAAKESGSFTCESLTGEATSATATTEDLTFKNLVYSNCKINGVTKVNVRTNECDYTVTSETEPAGGLNGTNGGATIHIICTGTKHIEIENTGTGCIFEVTPITLRGLHYHNLGSGSTTDVTIEALISAAASGTSIPTEVAKTGTGCVPKANVGDTLTGSYTTGNTTATGEKENKEMAEAWWL
jgi:hypothetical protein